MTVGQLSDGFFMYQPSTIVVNFVAKSHITSLTPTIVVNFDNFVAKGHITSITSSIVDNSDNFLNSVIFVIFVSDGYKKIPSACGTRDSNSI